MVVKTLAYTKPVYAKELDQLLIEAEEEGLTKEEFETIKRDLDMFGGHMAGICYMEGEFKDIYQESPKKTLRRIMQTQKSGHHSVYDHPHFTLELTGIPKIIAMLINNEKDYATSEKSARYTIMDEIDPEEKKLYDKWYSILKEEVKKEYEERFLKNVNNNEEAADKAIGKIAQENARYMISVFTPTKMGYTVSYRQLNYLYSWIDKFIENKNNNPLIEMMIPHMLDLKKALDIENDRLLKETDGGIGLLTKELQKNEKNRNFSLIEESHNDKEEYFGDVYCTTHINTYASLAQQHRHRTINYTMALLENYEFYVPEILIYNQELAEEWLKDIQTVKNNFPQGMLISINERGVIENLILKCMERDCVYAQKETCVQARATKQKAYEELAKKGHAKTEYLKEYLGICRATYPNYACLSPCGESREYKLNRKI